MRVAGGCGIEGRGLAWAGAQGRWVAGQRLLTGNAGHAGSGDRCTSVQVQASAGQSSQGVPDHRRGSPCRGSPCRGSPCRGLQLDSG